MNEEESENYTWELVGIHKITQERISFPCSESSAGAVISQIIKEQADGLWEIPEEIKKELQGIIGKGRISIGMISDLLDVDQSWTEGFIYGESDKSRLAADDVILLMELIRRLSKAPS